MKNRVALTILAVGFALAFPNSLSAEITVTPSPLIWGADLQLHYSFGAASRPTTAELGTAAGYLNTPYFRNPEDGSLYSGELEEFDPAEAPYFSRSLIRWNAGVRQALMYDESTEVETLGAFVRYVGYREWHFSDAEAEQLIFEADEPEADGQLLNTLRLGLDIGHVAVSEVTTTRSGWDSQIVGEWGPPQFGNELHGKADFARIGAQIRGFVPLFEAEPRMLSRDTESVPANQFALYAGAFAAGDYAFGARVPLSVRRSILRPLDDRSGLGGTVRGYESGRYDGSLKVAAGTEIRAVLPAIGRPDILPGLVVYLDGGVWRGLEGAPAYADERGTALATGGGVSISLFDLFTLLFYSHIALDDTLVDGSRVDPLAIGFGYHF